MTFLLLENELQFDGELKEYYNAWLNENRINSKNTSSAYEKRVKEFIGYMFKDTSKKLSIFDMENIKRKDVQNNYVKALQDKGNSHNTISVKLASVRSFFDYLRMNDAIINKNIFKIKLKNDVKHHDYMTRLEFENLIEFLEGIKSDYKKEYIMLSKLMWTTGLRIGASSELKWTDFKVKNEDGISINVFEIVEKGNKVVECALSEVFMEELLQYKENVQGEYLFPRCRTKAGYRDFLRKLNKYGETIDKKITAHSIRASAITYNWQRTKDIVAVKNFANHSRSSTTIDIYIKPKKNLTSQLSYTLDSELDFSNLSKYSMEEFIEILSKDENRDLAELIVKRLDV